MMSRPIAAIAAGLIAITAAPTLVLGIAVPAYAQTAAVTIQVQSAVTIAVNAAKASADYARLSPAQKAQRLAAAVQIAIASQLNLGASAADVSAALANLVNANFITLSTAAQGAAQAASQVAAQSGAGSGSKSQALQLVTSLGDGTGPLGGLVANAGGLQVAVSATNASGQTVSVVTSLSSVLAAAAAGNLGNATFNNGTLTIGGVTTTTGFTPCTNVIADYC